MTVSKMEMTCVIKPISPLAAAMAFALTLPINAHSQNFLVNTAVDDPEDEFTSLNEALAEIMVIEGPMGEHLITFDSVLSGSSISMDPFYIYGGAVTFDGSAATGLSLVMLESENASYGIYADYSELNISDVDIVLNSLGGSDPTGVFFYSSQVSLNDVEISLSDSHAPDSGTTFAMQGFGYSSDVTRASVNFSNVHIKGNIGNENAFGGFVFGECDVSISDSRFTRLKGADYVGLFAGETYSGNADSQLWDVTINNSTFSENNTTFVLGFYLQSTANVNLHIDQTSFKNNSVNNDILNISSGVYEQEASASRDIAITNSTFSNNQAGGSIITVLDQANDSDVYNSTQTIGLANVTIAENKSGNATVFVMAYADEAYSGLDSLEINFAHVTMSSNLPTEDSPGWEIPAALTLFLYSEEDVDVNIVNSIIANNVQAFDPGGEDPLEIIDSDIFSNLEINVDNTLIGVEFIVDTESSAITGANNLFGVQPGLEALADNGGATLTMNLKADSPAIDAGDSDFVEDLELFKDQRGKKRVLGDAPDMGAVEYFMGDENDDEVTIQQSSSGSGGFGLYYFLALFGFGLIKMYFSKSR